MKFRTALLLALSLCTALAQPPAGAPRPEGRGPGRGMGRGGGPVVSPEVSADRKVTLRLRAPGAREVSANIGMKRLPMVRDERGVWTATTEALDPDIYEYSFFVDGMRVADPSNPSIRPVFRSGVTNVVLVPGDNSWTPQSNVARGIVSHHFYHSNVVGDDRDFYVYTPPNYDRNRREPYPVLYLLHGLGDEASAWTAVGNANVILDNLIAQGKARPMIMVNTLGYGAPEMASGANRGGMNGPGVFEKNNAYFTRALLEEVVPQVEADYNASRDRRDRAVAGLSMGGAEALFAGLNRIDRFAYVASFSGALVMWTSSPYGPPAGGGRSMTPALAPETFVKTFPVFDAKTANSQLKLLWISCGTEDGLVGVNRQFRDWLSSKGTELRYQEHPGGHTWTVWRKNLTDLAPLLFRRK